MTHDIVVYLRGGTYNLTSTVVFGPSDSGTGGHRIVYQAYPGEAPVLMAATLVKGWKQSSGGIYTASLARSTKLRSLYVNDKRAYMASKTITCQGSSGTYSVTQGSAAWAWSSGSHADAVMYNLSDFPEITSNASDIEIQSSSTWNTATVCARSVSSDGTHRIVDLQQPYGAIAQRVDSGAGFQTGGGARHTVSNALAFLDAPGEFYFDKASGTLYYYPRSDEDMSTATVYAPAGVETLISVAGTSTSSRVSNLTFSGLTFEYSDWNLTNVAGSYGKANVQGSSTQIAYQAGQYQAGFMRRDDVAPDAIFVTSADSIVFERNVVAHTGADGIGMINDVSNSQLVGNYIYDMAGSAIVVSHPQHVYIGNSGPDGLPAGYPATHEKYPDGVAGKCSKDLIADNFIYHSAALFPGHAAIMAFYPDTVTITHNLIDVTGYNGISLGWGWWNFNGDSDSVCPGHPTTTMKNNTVTHNQIFSAMQALSDSGGVYTLAAQPNTTISNNYIKGIPGGQGRYGLHQDEGSAHLTLENNVLDTDLHAQVSINVGTWGRQHDMTYKNNYATLGTYADTYQQMPNSSCEPLKKYSDAVWPVDAYNICVAAGIEPLYQDIIPTDIIPLADIVFPASVTTSGGGAITIKTTGDATNKVWFAPTGTTHFSAGPTMTSADGTATTIKAPATRGTYRLFVVTSAGSVSAESSSALVVGS